MMRKILEFLKIVAISLLIVVPIRYFLINPFYVKGPSMEPTFYDREYLMIDEISYRFHNPIRGDVIVFRYPNNPQEYFIKRVIGLPGEKVEFKDGRVKIYNEQNPFGFQLDESQYLDASVQTNYYQNDFYTLKDGEYLVLGDNRPASQDSRSFGPLNKSFIIGRVMWRGWPFDRMTVFKTPTYASSSIK